MITLTDLNALRSVEELASHEREIIDQLNTLEAEAAGLPYSDEQRADYAALRERLDSKDPQTGVRARLTELRERADYRAKLAGDPVRQERSGVDLSSRSTAKSRIPENLWDISEYRARTSSDEAKVALMREGAMKAVELATYPHERAKHDVVAEHVQKLLASIDDERGALAQHILTTGRPEYIRAWTKTMVGKRLTTEERAAIDVVGPGALTTGGYAVPFTLDPTVILTSDGSVNPLRQIARVERIASGNTWKGVTTAGVTISRGPAEDQPVTPVSPTFGQPEVTVQPVKVEIQYSIEADEDWPRLQAELARILQDAKDEEEAESFVNGVGTTVYPGGIAATLDPSSYVGTTGDGFDLGDIRRLIGRLPDRYEPRAVFLGHRTVFGEIEALDYQSGGASIYRPFAAGAPTTLLGYPRYNSSAMSTDTTTDGQIVLIFGDFNNFLIVDKIGLSIEIDPHVRDGNGKWIGKRALLAHYRNSSVILNDNAFRALVIGVVTS